MGGGGEGIQTRKGREVQKKIQNHNHECPQTNTSNSGGSRAEHPWVGAAGGWEPPPGCQGAAGSRGGQAGGELEGQGWGGCWGGTGAAQSMPGAGSPPSAPLPARFAPPGTVWLRGGAGGQASSTAAGTLLSTEAKNAEREMKPEEDRGSGYVRAATVHSTTATAHGAWGAVFPPRGGAAVIWGGCSFFLPPPRATKWGTLSCKGQRRVGCTVRSLPGQVFE